MKSLRGKTMAKHVARFMVFVCLAVFANWPAAAESVLDKVKREGVLRVCNFQLMPDLYKNPKTNEWIGVMGDLMKQLADWMKVKIEPVEVVGSDVAILTLKQGGCD